MKHLLTFTLGIFFIATNIITLNDTLFAQSTILKSGLPASAGETQTDPFKSKFFKVRGTPELQVNIPNGDIEVFSNPSIDGVQVDLYVRRSFSLWSGTRSLETYRMIIQQRGDQIIASVEDTRTNRSARGTNVEFDIVIQVPADASANLRTMNGTISVNGVRGKQYLQNQMGDITVKNTDGEIRVATTMGNVQFENLTGNIYAKSVNGSIRVNHAEGEIRLRSVTGNITADNIKGTLISGTTTGNIDADFNSVTVGIYVETVSGNINLAIPAAGYTIDGKALRFNFNDLNQESITSRNIRGQQANIVIREGDLPVNLSSVSGLISVRETNQ
jgi:hypothetical protein